MSVLAKFCVSVLINRYPILYCGMVLIKGKTLLDETYLFYPFLLHILLLHKFYIKIYQFNKIYGNGIVGLQVRELSFSQWS